MEWIENIEKFFDSIKTIFIDVFKFLPAEIYGLLITAIVIVIALFIYRFLR